MEFVGRIRELEYLEELYAEGGSRCMIYGRRRVGKSTLIERFCEGKPAIVFNCTRGTDEAKLEYMADVLSEFIGQHMDRPKSFYSMFKAVASACVPGTVVVFDEFPYLVEKRDDIPTEVQRFVDVLLKGRDAMVIVCGSSVSVMEEELTERSKPLYGRFNHRLRLQPMSCQECALLHPSMSPDDAVRLYLSVGGVPLYHRQAGDGDYRDAIWRLFLRTNAILSDEAEVLINSELTSSGRYILVLSAIAGGATNLKEISGRTQIDESSCKKYLANLKRLGFVASRNPMAGAPKRPSYYISDNMIAFHYMLERRHIRPDDKERTFADIGNDISAFLGRRFEGLCAEYLERNHRCIEIGTWWGRVDEEDGRAVIGEIDLVAKVEVGGLVAELFCECKFRGRPAGMDVLNELERRMDCAQRSDNSLKVIFSWGGFTDELEERAEGSRDLFLVSREDILNDVPIPLDRVSSA